MWHVLIFIANMYCMAVLTPLIVFYVPQDNFPTCVCCVYFDGRMELQPCAVTESGSVGRQIHFSLARMMYTHICQEENMN